jgi:tricorn protease interacting factor F2/3
MLRDQLLFHAVLYGSETAKEFGLRRFSILQKENRVHPDIAKSVMLVGAFCRNDEAFDWFVEKLKTSDSEHERMNVLMAMGKFKEKETIEKALKFVLEEVPDRNKFIPIGSMTANPYAIPLMWQWYVSNLEKLEKFHPIHYERVIGGIVPICGLGKEKEVKTFLGNYLEQKSKARDIINLSLEKLEIYSRMRNLGSKNAEI